mmetsp:Transcript_42612/g.106590  ORF Transcript_42612/g.106590 Transcript_42612/m.106590 type:complete len:301 (-) Transcript_42612:321-1223(-)
MTPCWRNMTLSDSGRGSLCSSSRYPSSVCTSTCSKGYPALLTRSQKLPCLRTVCALKSRSDVCCGMFTASLHPSTYPAKLRDRRLIHSSPIMICIWHSPSIPSPWCSSCIAVCPGWLMARRPFTLPPTACMRICLRCILSARPPMPGTHMRRSERLRSQARTARLPDDLTRTVTLSLRGASNQVAVVAPSLAPPPLTSLQREDPERFLGREPDELLRGSELCERLRGMGDMGDLDLPDRDEPLLLSWLPCGGRESRRPLRAISYPTVPGVKSRANPDLTGMLWLSASMAGPRWMRFLLPT